MDSVATLRARRQALLDSVDAEVPSGPGDLTNDQRRAWVPLEVAVIDAAIAQHEFLNSLLPEPLSDEDRARMIEDLFQEDVEVNGKEYARSTDWTAVSDFDIVQDHARYEEALADWDPSVLPRPDSPSLQDITPQEMLDIDAEAHGD